MPKIWYVALPNGPLPSPWVQDGPAPGGPRFKPPEIHYKKLKSSSE